MKKLYFVLIGLLVFSGVEAQIINFTNPNFKSELLMASTYNGIAHDLNGNNVKIDTNSDGEIQLSEVYK